MGKTIDEMQKMRGKLEREIAELINIFMEETGVTITGLHLNLIDARSFDESASKYKVAGVEVEVKL